MRKERPPNGVTMPSMRTPVTREKIKRAGKEHDADEKEPCRQVCERRRRAASGKRRQPDRERMIHLIARAGLEGLQRMRIDLSRKPMRGEGAESDGQETR